MKPSQAHQPTCIFIRQPLHYSWEVHLNRDENNDVVGREQWCCWSRCPQMSSRKRAAPSNSGQNTARKFIKIQKKGDFYTFRGYLYCGPFIATPVCYFFQQGRLYRQNYEMASYLLHASDRTSCWCIALQRAAPATDFCNRFLHQYLGP